MGIEKNPTIVTFPLKGLDLRDYIHPDCQPANPETKYDLVANVCHDGKPEKGTYKVQVFHHPTGQWFELHDLRVTPVLPQMVALTESYIQVYHVRMCSQMATLASSKCLFQRCRQKWIQEWQPRSRWRQKTLQRLVSSLAEMLVWTCVAVS